MSEKDNKETSNAAAFGIDKETAEKIRTDILPPVALGDVAIGSSIRLKLLSDEPKMVKHKQVDPKTKKETEVETPVFKVHNPMTGMDEALWLSSTSLKMEMLKLSKLSDGQLEGKTVIIKVDEYKHEVWGQCRGYRSQIVNEDAEGAETTE